MEVNKFCITKLSGSNNYQIWKYKLELLLMKEELWNVVSEDPPIEPRTESWAVKDGKAKATIGLLIEDQLVVHIRNCKTAKDMWECLRKQYEKPNLTNKVFLLKRLCRMNLQEGGNMEKHINEVLDIIQQLSSLGEDLAEKLQVALLLCSLPDSYGGLVTALEGRPETDLTLEMVKGKLIEEYQRRMQPVHSSDMALKINNKYYNNNSRRSIEKYCSFCKKKGHYKRDCYHYKRQNERKYSSKANIIKGVDETESPNESENDYCFNVTDSYQEDSSWWYIDSGASSHMTNEKSFFTKYTPLKGEVELADGRKVCTYGTGTGILRCPLEDGRIMNITVKNVLFVPDLGYSLLSVKRLTNQGFEVNFNSKHCNIMHNKRIIAQGVVSGNLYRLNYRNEALAVWDCKSNNGCIHVWHRRFGHRDPAVVKIMATKALVQGMDVRTCAHVLTCEVCKKGKMSRKHFPKKSQSKTQDILDLVHTDLCGPMRTVTPGGKKYILTCIDDYSRYCIIYLLSKKSEVIDKIKEYVKFTENKFKKKPKIIRSDRGGEYVNLEMKKYLREEGIELQLSAPYSSQQNGIAERKNRYLIEMIRCMLIDANLPNKYWGEAAMTANYIENLILTKSINKIPYEVWNKRKPSVNHLKTFGSIAYVHIPKEKRSKLQDKARRCIFVGYETGSKAYRLLDKETDKICISRDMDFIEDFHDGYHKPNNETDSQESGKKTLEEVEIFSRIEINKEEKQETSVETIDEEESCSTEDSDKRKDDKKNYGDKIEFQARKSQRINKGKPPKRYGQEEEYNGDISVEPKTRKEALERPDAEMWIKAMDEEISSMKANGTWTLHELPPTKSTIATKWVFKLKTDSQNKVTRYKARLVAKGYSQKYGQDYDEVFAPVVKQATFRLLLTMAGMQKMLIYHYDFKTAFLNANLEEELYLDQPEGYVENEHLACKLNKSIYGLKQAARLWNQTIDNVFIEIGFRRGVHDQCLYVKQDKELTYILIYVDDILIVSKNIELIKMTEKKLSKHFQITCLGEVENYLGVQVRRDESGYYYINQRKYIKKIINNFRMDMEKNFKVSAGYSLLQDQKRIM